MRKMINEKQRIDKVLEEIIKYAETFDTGRWDFDTWSFVKSYWKALMTPSHSPLTLRAHHHCETPARTGGTGNTIHMQILCHLSIQLEVLAGELNMNMNSSHGQRDTWFLTVITMTGTTQSFNYTNCFGNTAEKHKT